LAWLAKAAGVTLIAYRMMTDFDRSVALYVQVTVVFVLVVCAGLTFSPVVAAICAGETVVHSVRLLVFVVVVVLAVVAVDDVDGLEHADDISGSMPRAATNTKVRRTDHRGERTG
jgi:hypothetical protein